MEVWKIMFLSKWVICRFHVNLPGCNMQDAAVVRDGLSTYEPWNLQILGQPILFGKHSMSRIGWDSRNSMEK